MKVSVKTSNGESYRPVTAPRVQPYRCSTEMSRPSGEINFETTTGDLRVHAYGRLMIHRPKDNDILNEDSGDEGYTSATRCSTAQSSKNYAVIAENNNHLTGYETMSKNMQNTMNWKETRPDMNTTNSLMYP